VEDGQTVTVLVYQRFAEALNERPIKLNFQILTDHATFDREAFDRWRKYGKALTAPAEVTADLPGGLGDAMSGGVAQVSIGPVGQTQDARFRIRRPDGTTGEPLPFSITMSEGAAGNSGHGSDHTGFLDFEMISDRKTRLGTWEFKRKKLVGAEVVAALPSIEFMQELRAPNTLEIAQKYGQFVTYAEIPPTDYVFPDALVDYLRALAAIQTATATPILIPDLTTISRADAEAVAEAAALVSGQKVLSTWSQLAMAGGPSIPTGRSPTEHRFPNEYELLVFERFFINVGEQSLLLGTVAKMALSARYSAEGATVIARPYRNDALQKWLSPDPDAAGPHHRRVLGRVIGTIEDSTGSDTSG
jgi:hypothetical protein